MLGMSPLIISWIAPSSASTLVDIWFIRSRIWDDISSNLVSSCSRRDSTKAVNSWGLDISDAAKVFGGELIGVGFFESATLGSLDGVEAGVKLSGRGMLDPGRDPCDNFW